MSRTRTLFLSGLGSAVSRIAGSPSAQKLLFNAIRLDRPEFSRLWSNDDIRFLSYVFAKREHSRSQILQDLWVCFELGEKRHGFFVEFGATNGLTNSNTWLLETEFAWNGIVAEPNPVWHADLVAVRRASIETRCVASASGRTVSFIACNDSDPELSAMEAFSAGDHFAALRRSGTRIDVETISLNDLLRDHKAPAQIDFLSIDTEGSEFDILSAFDFENYQISLLSVEQNPSTEMKIDNLLQKKGYTRVFEQFSQWDGWYVAAGLRNKPKRAIVAPRS